MNKDFLIPIISQKYNALGQDDRIKGIILHYTAEDLKDSIQTLVYGGKVSTHYLIDIGEGEIYQLVNDYRRAWHAGISCWQGINNLNYITIGIEIVNLGFKLDSQGKRIWYPYDNQQIKKIIDLINYLKNKYKITNPDWIIGHYDIAPGRKQDPGPLFPWDQLYENGIGIWATKDDIEKYGEPFPLDDIAKVQKYLSKIGYECPQNNILDKDTLNCVWAFNMHFLQEDLEVLTEKTILILSTLINKYYPS